MCVCVCVCVCVSLNNKDKFCLYNTIGIRDKRNSAYVGFTTTTLSRRLTMHLNDSISIPILLKNSSITKSKFRKILLENTTIIAHEIDKIRLQILETLHLKTKIPKINRINFENSDNVLKCF